MNFNSWCKFENIGKKQYVFLSKISFAYVAICVKIEHFQGLRRIRVHV